MSRYIYGANGEAWFWRAWTNRDSLGWDGERERHRDFKTKREATEHAARYGGGTIRKIRYRGTNSTEARMDSIEVPERLSAT